MLRHPETKEQLAAVKAFASALKLKFETTETVESPCRTAFVQKILQGKGDVRNGKGVNP